MALEEFEKEQLNEREKGYVRMRSIMDLGMGVLWTAMGVFLIFIKKLSPDMALQFDTTLFKIFAVVCIIYGAWRIYRGIKKNYLRNR